MNGKWQSDSKGSWTAISRIPWLKAIKFFPKGDCWNGGGIFTDSSTYWLNDGYGHENILDEDKLIKRDTKYIPSENYGGECPSVYYLRLQRDGWILKERSTNTKYDSYSIFEKALIDGWILVKTAHEQVDAPKGKGCYWDEHACVNEITGENITFPDWEWADFKRGRLLYSEKGCLYSTTITSQSQIEKGKLLYDFNDLVFEEIVAPY